MNLVTIDDLGIRYHGPPLLDGISLRIDEGQRIGLLGRNGAGKTTLMRLLAGEQQPDHGTITFRRGGKAALLPQDVPQTIVGTIGEVVSSALAGASSNDDGREQHQATRAVNEILSRMELDGSVRFESQSAGLKRRALLARTLVNRPDLLLLDEPTNHLDLMAIEWLEQFLSKYDGTILFVTHDRTFLKKIATRIIEIDRGAVFDWSCDYETFLKRKEAALLAEEKQQAEFDRKLAQEEVWIRTGIKARRTRNEGRVRALERMRAERQQRRARQGTTRLTIQEASRSGDIVVQAEAICFGYEGRDIVRKFDTLIERGDKVGIIGPNGAGKTTLLRLLLGQFPPQSGTIRLGRNLQIAYFDQLRQQLDERASIQQNVGDGYESITINGRSRHIIGYLQDFLFSAERSRTEVRFLSGGERNRVLLAKLFAKPANVIVLDEPTNDLDEETLELLESRLVEFEGTVLVVSHDRTFLNNVVTSTIVFEDSGPKEYAGGYDDWVAQRSAASATMPAAKRSARQVGPPATMKTPSRPTDATDRGTSEVAAKRKLSYKEQRELESLPAVIEQLETRIADIHDRMADADFYRQPGDLIASEKLRLQQCEAELQIAYARWEQLEQSQA
ncbi:MAG: ATP-binding cassette domain-containing protein [Planctomycetales bacterium]|nr:ATP-binding cassette domain-containing protein [Planctomycetales bacterium]